MKRIGVEGVSGLFLIAFAAAMLWFGRDLSLGTAARMGPGFVPFWVAVAIGVLGACITLLALGKPDGPSEPSRPLRVLAILGCILMFALLVEVVGFIIASFALVFVSSLSSPDKRFLQSIILGVLLTAFAAAGFVWGLSIPIKTLPW